MGKTSSKPCIVCVQGKLWPTDLDRDVSLRFMELDIDPSTFHLLLCTKELFEVGGKICLLLSSLFNYQPLVEHFSDAVVCPAGCHGMFLFIVCISAFLLHFSFFLS